MILAPVMTVSRFSSRERKTGPEITGTGSEPRPARQAILDSVRWLQAQAEGELLPETGEPVAEATV
jgi:hypothetical protein